MRLRQDGGLHSLHIAHVGSEDEGLYAVSAANTHGQAHCSAQLYVEEPRTAATGPRYHPGRTPPPPPRSQGCLRGPQPCGRRCDSRPLGHCVSDLRYLSFKGPQSPGLSRLSKRGQDWSPPRHPHTCLASAGSQVTDKQYNWAAAATTVPRQP